MYLSYVIDKETVIYKSIGRLHYNPYLQYKTIKKMFFISGKAQKVLC